LSAECCAAVRTKNSSMLSRVPRLSTRRYPQPQLGRLLRIDSRDVSPAAVNRYLPPAPAPELSSKPAARRCCYLPTGQTDGRTDGHPIVTSTVHSILCGQRQQTGLCTFILTILCSVGRHYKYKYTLLSNECNYFVYILLQLSLSFRPIARLSQIRPIATDGVAFCGRSRICLVCWA